MNLKMKYFSRILISFLFITFLFSTADAQTDEKEEEEQPKTRLEISAEGLSNAIYAGRNFGINQFGFNPGITFCHKSGLNLSLMNFGMSKSIGFIEETDLGISFTKNVSSSFSITPGYTHLFNYADSTKILNNMFDLETDVDLDFVSLSNSISVTTGSSTAFYDMISASKSISVFNQSDFDFSISPTIACEMGSKLALLSLGHGKKGYRKSIKKTTLKNATKAKAATKLKAASTTTVNSNTFEIFCYDLNLPITIKLKAIELSVVPSYAIPVNVTKTESTLNGNPFYVVADVTYTIPFYRK